MTVKDYYKQEAREIYDDIINSHSTKEKITIKGIDLYVLPHVYPSDKFRTTNFVLESIEPLVANATVCDMGCGLGIVGQFALRHGAAKVLQVDINPHAVENASLNKAFHGFSDDQLMVCKSDCFESVPLQKFDLIVFNMPFHTENHEIKDPLEHAFYDPLFRGLKKFLEQLPKYSHEKTLITIAFSNKGNIAEIESIFNSYKLNWTLWKIINADKEYDNRIYLIKDVK